MALLLSAVMIIITSQYAPLWSRKIQGNYRESVSARKGSTVLSRRNTSVNINHIQQESVSIRFANLYLTTGYTKRLRNVSGQISANKVTAIVGGSGAGKTSLMNVLLGREHVDSGSTRSFHILN